MEGLSFLSWCGEVSVIQGSVQKVEHNGRVMNTLLDLLRPFAVAYSCAAQTVVSFVLLCFVLESNPCH